MHKAPILSKFLIISDNPHLTARISSVLGKKKHYTPVIDCPRLTRHDANNEILRRNNAAARFQPNPIIFAGVEKEVKNSFQDKFPEKIVKYVERAEDLKDVKEFSNN